MEREDKDHHWFQIFAVQDRVTGKELLNDALIGDVATLPLQTFLPTVDECSRLNDEFGVLIARVITENIDYFQPLQSVVPQHILHKYTDLMKLKSKMVSFGAWFC